MRTKYFEHYPPTNWVQLICAKMAEKTIFEKRTESVLEYQSNYSLKLSES